MIDYTILQQSLAHQTFGPGLYLVATPIGNLADLSLRALETFEKADLVLCEDTRVTGALLKMLGLKKTLWSYHDHNEDRQGPKIIEELKKGKIIVLVSDAGTPLISDPGYKLVEDVRKQGIHVTSVPGPVAFVNALILSGLPTDRFFFGGFLPHKGKKKVLEQYKAFPFVLIFYEGPTRIKSTLAAIHEILGDRFVVLAKELTKKFEQVTGGQTSDLLAKLDQINLKGEFVILVAPSSEPLSEETSLKVYEDTLKIFSLKEGATHLAKALGKSKREVYQKLLETKKL
ncbi:MAG: 16S rRNA (cytidine(1402)-2'-O)-methyltransferase [Alphaproteobacteria bacterium]